MLSIENGCQNRLDIEKMVILVNTPKLKIQNKQQQTNRQTENTKNTL